ncbi:MAG: MCP four helix bundle domain-containing protein [Fibrobacteria bacterium]|nr:MCP four helix bundle domain-containing protein [Fibrobacteria bacterium]
MFRNMKLGIRLGIGFGLMVAIIAGLVLFSLQQVDDLDQGITLVVEDRMVKTRQANEAISQINLQGRYLRNMILSSNVADMEADRDRVLAAREVIGKIWDTLDATITSEEGRRLLDRVQKARPALKEGQDKMMPLTLAGKDSAAVAILFGTYREAQKEYLDAVDELIHFQQKLAQTDGMDADLLAQKTQAALKWLLFLALVVAGGIGWFITRSITAPVAKCIDIASKVARGETNIAIEVDSKDEIGKLMETMKHMVAIINDLIGQMNHMAADHDRGEIDTSMDEGKFHGAFGEMARGVNGMAFGHLAVQKKAMACVAEFGRGNFDAPLEKFPGKKAFINENIEAVRTNIKEFIQQMNSMSNDHDRGEIDTAIPADRFQGSFQVMAKGVNDMVFGHIAVKKKAMACVMEFGRGNFDAPLEKFPGKKAFINETIEKVRENLKALISDTDSLVTAALGGQLATRADATRHQGDFRKIVEGVNNTLDAVINPINEAASVLEKIAARDLTARVMGNYQGDLNRIKMAVNTAVDNLDKALAQVGQATLQVSSASQQISAGSQSLAQGANEQASSLEEVSSSLEEMASMTRQNAENALQAKNLAGEADGNARQGGEAMGRMNGSIVKIKESSDQTAKIVKTIDEIAMQTNLLALNAAVEAARAGEAGRGFAVVAEEVRNLAQRSAQAAKNTADMIGESVKNADEGVKIAQEVAKSFEQIASSSRKVNDLIAEIASASKEQSQGIEQVNSAVSQMDKVTQQTAANAEESASSSEELSSQAEELQSMVAQFRITQDIGASRQPQAIAPGARRRALPPPTRKAAPPSRNQVVDPEDVIPMDDATLREF